jgi:hypothetical protein
MAAVTGMRVGKKSRGRERERRGGVDRGERERASGVSRCLLVDRRKQEVAGRSARELHAPASGRRQGPFTDTPLNFWGFSVNFKDSTSFV